MTTYPLPTLAATVTAAGITAPSYTDTLLSLQASFKSIYGSDAVLDADSQDGQLLAVFAKAIFDCNQTAIAVYNSFSPATAQGTGLSSVVKINGIRRLVSSLSTATVTITGTNGTVINNGLVADPELMNQWALPSVVTIPSSGSIDVTATCQNDGAILALPNTLTFIVTPVAGWNNVSNAAAATPGAPVEQDLTLRQRQSLSVANPSQAVLLGIIGAVANLSNVHRVAGYENDTSTTDGDGIPAHSMAIVVEGGDIDQIAATIGVRKPPGIQTYGTTSVNILDQRGVPKTINFFQVTEVPITAVVNIRALGGYQSTAGATLVEAFVGAINALDVGDDVLLGRLWAPADLSGSAAVAATGLTQAQLDVFNAMYEVTSILIARDAGTPTAADVTIAFNEAAQIGNAAVTLNVS